MPESPAPKTESENVSPQAVSKDDPRNNWDFGPRLLEDPLARVVLIEPLIPENTGNASRTCVGTNSELHLVKPLAFELTEKRVRRAGLDYWKDLGWKIHESHETWRRELPDPSRVFLIETSGRQSIFEAKFKRGDWLVFGNETSGLSPEMLAEFDGLREQRGDGGGSFHIPMPGATRSLNLSNSVAICVFELLRQLTAGPTEVSS